MASTASTACVALGSNLGDRDANLREALYRLTAEGDVTLLRVSRFIDNPAVGGPTDSPPFLNAAAAVDSTLPPLILLQRLLDIEQAMGRLRTVRWAPRLIDLDLLLYGDEILQTPQLTLPHPLLHERAFVLQPLAEVVPHAVHPVLRETMSALWDQLRRKN